MNPRPLPRDQALARMLALVGKPIAYYLGTGDSTGETTRNDGHHGMDCAGAAISYAYSLPRHRPGYNRGSWATVSDDLNTNSALEDAQHARDLFVEVAEPLPGDLIMYPTIHLPGHDRPWIGHVQLVTEVPAGWTRAMGWAGLKVAHCHGPDGRAPGVTLSDGSACDKHDELWTKPEHRTRLLRIVP